jgi:hypothetical protein
VLSDAGGGGVCHACGGSAAARDNPLLDKQGAARNRWRTIQKELQFIKFDLIRRKIAKQ